MTYPKRGDRGEAVRSVQKMILAKYGKAMLPKWGADGVFGQEMENAVVTIQGREKLPVSGILDDRTIAAIKYLVPQLITLEQLRKLCPRLPAEEASEITHLLNEIAPMYGMTNVNLFEEFLATIIEESGEFSRLSENLNYSAKRLREVWPSRFPNDAIAAQYAGNPVKLANRVYADRIGNGNEASGDGWKYRGGGAMQLTGKANYLAYAKYKGMPISTVAELVHTSHRWSIDSAAWFFSVHAGLLDAAKRDDFRRITKVVNGGYINFDTRMKYLNKIKAVLG